MRNNAEVRILVRSSPHASRELARRSYAAGAGDVDVNILGILRIDEQTVRVRSAAGLNVADVLRIVDVADVEDANSTQPILADRVLYATGAAVDPGGEIFARDEQEILVDRDIALRGRAEVRRLERRLAGIRDIPDLITAEASLNDVVAEEGQVGVDALANFSDGLVSESTLRFQTASAAS